MPDPTLKNVFEAILKYGHDEDFAPKTMKISRPPSAGRHPRKAGSVGRTRSPRPTTVARRRPRRLQRLPERSAPATNGVHSGLVRASKHDAVAAFGNGCDGVVFCARSLRTMWG